MQTDPLKTKVLVAPPEATAAVFFCPGQLYFAQLRDSMQSIKPISANTFKLAGSEVEIDTGWLPPHVVRCGEGPRGAVVMSYMRPERREILVHFKGTEPTKLQLPLPGLILAGCGQSYRVFALREPDFRPSAKLFHAPLPNIDANGKLCFGRNKVPQASPQTMGEVWQLFFDSPFNADQMQNKSAANMEDVRKSLRRVAREKPDSYPLDDLVPYGIYGSTVEDFWKTITVKG